MIISGQLLTKVGGPVQWATITFDPSIGDSISFETDFEGVYSQDIPVGNYRVYKKEKHGIDIELLGCDIFVSQDSTLAAILDQGIPAFTAATLPDPATLAISTKAVLAGAFSADVTAVSLTVDFVKGVKSWTGTVVSANDPVNADGLPNGVTWIKV